MRVYGALAAGIVAVSLAAIFIRLALDTGVPPQLIAGARLTIATLVLTPFVLLNHRERLRLLSREELRLALISGVFLAVHFLSWISSIGHTSILISVVLVSTGPIWVALLEWIFLKTRLPRTVIFGLVLTLIGAMLVGFPTNTDQLSQTQGNPLLGAVLSIIGAIAFAVYLIIGRKLRAEMPLLPYIWLVYGCAAITLILVLILTQTPVTGYKPESYLLMLGVALLPQLIGHTSFNYAVGYLPATVVGIIGQAEPIGSALIALVVLQEVPGPIALIGSLFILVGVIRVSLGQSTKQADSN
jgi:drug/metabolite transporter (DMT)-like permease